MKSLIIILSGILFANSFTLAQKEIIHLNTKQNLFSVNEFDRIMATDPSYKPTESITVFVDTTKQTTFEFRSHIFPQELQIQTFPDGGTDTTILIGSAIIQALPVCITYYGTEQMKISIEDNRFVAVQQVLDSTGNWISMEHFIHSSCGNSYSRLTLNKNESCLFKIAKYTGNYTTKRKVKRYSDRFYLSNTFAIRK